MKIITDDAVYVQKKDISELLRSDMPMPGLMSILGNSSYTAFIDDVNGKEFVKLTENNEKEFFIKQDWILDFDEVKNLCFSELVDLGQKTSNDRNDIAKKFNSLPDREKDKLYDETMLTCKLLDYKIESIKEFVFIKKGWIAVPWPSDVKIPDDIVLLPHVEYIASKTKTKPNVFQLIKSKFKKNV